MPEVAWRECRHRVVAEVSPFLWWASRGAAALACLFARSFPGGGRTCAPTRASAETQVPAVGAAYPAFDAKLTRQQERPAATE